MIASAMDTDRRPQQPANPAPELPPQWQRRRLRRWLAELPVADLHRTAHLLHAALIQLRQSKLPPAKRFACIELLRPHVKYTVEGLQPHIVSAEFPLPRNATATVTLVQALLRETARCYHTFSLEKLQGEKTLNLRTLAIAIARSLHYSGLLLMESYATFQDPPPGLWRRIHTLYQLADSEQLTERNVEEPESPNGKTTVSRCYKHILLFAAAHPYGLAPEGTRQLYRSLARWANYLQLAPEPGTPLLRAKLWVDTGSDIPPTPVTGQPSAAGRVYLLSTDALKPELEKYLQPRRPRWRFWQPEERPADACLLEKVSFAVMARPTRQPADGQLHAVTGLLQANRHLSFVNGLDDRLTGASMRFQTPPPKAAVKHRRSSPSSPSRHTDAISEKNSPPLVSRWRIVNTCERGYCLHADLKQPIKVQIGDIIALKQRIDGAPKWELATIKWARFSDRHGLRIGVHVLGADPVPAITWPLSRNRTAQPPNRSLILLNPYDVHGTPTLVTPRLGYTPQRQVLLKSLEGQTEVTLLDEVESDGLFSQYAFRAPASTASKETAVTTGKARPDRAKSDDG
ncbi:hypothetical protein CAI21_02710 [Alkalilimnicola ehrlichii]|uniref:GTPase n=1 Tax=Alkalilimnicola ehrlichii TaxID=351052 RepID=A0A3E0X0Q5_9GAMM|nr:hypothetical protein [Alkalilimnicola ehrlichii]RFA30907.1 hypothetical protein CAI21_02710 [Alkalilimnicola ehrlichii]RFA38858.1 hypothetical protein CAL65_02850 [Alkalilimnicola ehrlichii]